MQPAEAGPKKIERNKFEFLQGEIEAGFVFAAAVEHQIADPATAMTCRAEAEDCYATALKTTRQVGLTNDQRQQLESMLQRLRKVLDGLSQPFAAA